MMEVPLYVCNLLISLADEYDLRRLQMRTKIQDMCRRPGFPVNLSFSEVDCFNEKMLATLRKKVKDHINSAQLRGQKIMGGLVPHNYVVSTFFKKYTLC